MSPKKETAATAEKNKGFTKEEKAAMRERARELKAAERVEKNRAEGEKDIFEKIGEMPDAEGSMARRIHEIITENAPDLMPRTWYGMPAYARDGKILCFFQGASKFDSRYSTLGFNDIANLDDGAMWPTSFAVVELTAAAEARIAELVKKAVS